jgi:hypothetical protein
MPSVPAAPALPAAPVVPATPVVPAAPALLVPAAPKPALPALPSDPFPFPHAPSRKAAPMKTELHDDAEYFLMIDGPVSSAATFCLNDVSGRVMDRACSVFEQAAEAGLVEARPPQPSLARI